MPCVVPINLTRTDEYPDCADEEERWRRLGQNDHVRAYSKQRFIGRLKSIGFNVWVFNRNYFTEQEMFENSLADGSTVYAIS